MDDVARIPLDAETKVAERPHDHKDELRLWLRLFTCKEVIETEVRRRLRDSFEVTLPRFDLLAQLDRAPKGMTLGELSQRMMVSNGNVTGLVDRLVEQGLINRRPSPKDRRAQIVSLTRRGAPVLPRHGAGERRLDRGDVRRPLGRRHRDAAAPPGQDQGVGAQGHRQWRAAMSAANPVTLPLKGYAARHVRLAVDGKVATITLDRPDKKNPLTFESYAELADLFRAAAKEKAVKAFVICGAGGNFCSGGDVFEIIAPLTKMAAAELLDFTRMTGEVIKAMRACPQPIVAAIDGVCAGAGAILAMASDLRLGTPTAKVAFLFNRVGLAGCDMGACAMLPRIIGQGRAAELLYTGRVLGGEEAERWGFFNRLVPPDAVLAQAQHLATELAAGPTFANGMTKRMLEMEWAMSVESAIEAEAVAQALCMETEDFARAFRAFAAKQKPVFEGN